MHIQITCAFGETRVVLDRSAAQFWAVLTTCRPGPHVPEGSRVAHPSPLPPSSLTFQDADVGQPGAVRIEPPDAQGTSCSLQFSPRCLPVQARPPQWAASGGPRLSSARRTQEVMDEQVGSLFSPFSNSHSLVFPFSGKKTGTGNCAPLSPVVITHLSTRGRSFGPFWTTLAPHVISPLPGQREGHTSDIPRTAVKLGAPPEHSWGPTNKSAWALQLALGHRGSSPSGWMGEGVGCKAPDTYCSAFLFFFSFYLIFNF